MQYTVWTHSQTSKLLSTSHISHEASPNKLLLQKSKPCRDKKTCQIHVHLSSQDRLIVNRAAKIGRILSQTFFVAEICAITQGSFVGTYVSSAETRFSCRTTTCEQSGFWAEVGLQAQFCVSQQVQNILRFSFISRLSFDGGLLRASGFGALPAALFSYLTQSTWKIRGTVAFWGSFKGIM